MKILLNSIKITLDQFLYHFVKCCGYPIWCLRSKEYKTNKFGSMQPTKRISETKKRRNNTFSQLILTLHSIWWTWNHDVDGVSTVKNYYFFAFWSLNFFVGCIDPNLFALYSLDPRQHIWYPQHLTKWYRKLETVLKWFE